jgi:cofilin
LFSSAHCAYYAQILANPSLKQASSGVSVAPECISAFNDLKLKKELKYIIYKISDDWKEIVVEETSTDGDYSTFRQKLLDAKSKDKKGKEGIGGRYAVFDIEYDLESGEGKRNKITFISWCPDDAPQYVSAFCNRWRMNETLTKG